MAVGVDAEQVAEVQQLLYLLFAEFAEKSMYLQRNRVYCGKCRIADVLKLQDFPHVGRRALLNGVQEVAGSNPVAPTQAARGEVTVSYDNPCGFFFFAALPGVGQ
jgi:hypothetical protein